MCDRGRNAAHAQPKEERSIQMSQKKIEEQQRKILFAHFKAGTLERKMDTAYRGEETAETAKTSEPVEAAKTTELRKRRNRQNRCATIMNLTSNTCWAITTKPIRVMIIIMI